MASTTRKTSTLSQRLSSEEEAWQDFIAWDDELYYPLVQGELGIESPSSGNARANSFTSQAPQSASEQGYIPSTATSVYDEPFSFDYVISRPASVTEGPSSLDQGHSWLSTSPSYTTSATSPLAAQAGVPYRDSLDAYETMLSPGSHIPPASPGFDAHSWGSSSSYQTAPASGFFNPYVAGTSHSFSGLDVYASQALYNVGTWVEPSVEPIIEVHQEDGSGAMPIPIPQTGSHRPNDMFLPHSWNHQTQNHSPWGPARAITIPQPHHGAVRSNITTERYPSIRRQSPQTFRGVPPLLSVSPEQRRTSRTAQLSRSLSNPRRNRTGSFATPSPSSADLGWVSYTPDDQHRLKPSGAEGGHRRHKGRTGPLSAQRRSEAAVMRHVGSCSNCKKRKEKCDPGTPCKSCIDHYGSDLINHPCRDRLISGLARVFLAERHGWHPTARATEASSSKSKVPSEPLSIPIIFGFGSRLHLPVSLVRLENDKTDQLHEHTVYSWPPDASPSEVHNHAVLPAILTAEAMDSLGGLLDVHLSLLVNQHFSSFPPFCSPLRILRHVYVYWRSLSPNTSYSRLLQQALKLLVLVHVGGDIALPPPSSDPTLDQIVQETTSLPPDITPTPCFIRSQFGSVMPPLALKLMREILLSLQHLFLRREVAEWPVALATLIVLLMTVESIQYHSAKLPYHHASASASASSSSSSSTSASTSPTPHAHPPSHQQQAHDFPADDDAVRQILEFYAACFSGCHARLRPDWRGDVEATLQAKGAGGIPAEDKFVEEIRGAVRRATPGYLVEKARAEREGDDMGFFFDRLVARLLVMGVGARGE